MIVAVMLITLAALGQMILLSNQKVPLISGMLLLFYFLLNLFYSRGGKNVAISLRMVVPDSAYRQLLFGSGKEEE